MGTTGGSSGRLAHVGETSGQARGRLADPSQLAVHPVLLRFLSEPRATLTL